MFASFKYRLRKKVASLILQCAFIPSRSHFYSCNGLAMSLQNIYEASRSFDNRIGIHDLKVYRDKNIHKFHTPTRTDPLESHGWLSRRSSSFSFTWLSMCMSNTVAKNMACWRYALRRWLNPDPRWDKRTRNLLMVLRTNQECGMHLILFHRKKIVHCVALVKGAGAQKMQNNITRWVSIHKD